MNHRTISTLAVLAVGVFCACGLMAADLTTADPSGQTVPNDNTVLTFEDTFKGGKLDTAKWNPFYPWPCVINHEMQAYVPAAFHFDADNGLHIQADKHEFEKQPYTSGALTTSGKFAQAYGYFVLRAKLPAGRGFWPAFWLMPPQTDTDNPGGSEIDVMEALGHETHTIHTTLHYLGVVSKKGQGFGLTVNSAKDFSDDYHNFAVCWRPQLLVWLVDGQEVFRVEGSQVPSIPEYVLVNLAVGGSWPGAPDAQTTFPSSMDVRYVKVYQYKDLLSTPEPSNFSVRASTLSAENVRPGDFLTVTTPIKVGSTAYPNLKVFAQVTDFHGSHYVDPVATTMINATPGATVSAVTSFPVPANLVPGIYTISLGITSENPKRVNFIGCVGRFTVK